MNLMRLTKKTQKAMAAMEASVAAHRRYAEIERAIDAMYERADAFSPTWMVEKCEMEIELAGLQGQLEAEN